MKVLDYMDKLIVCLTYFSMVKALSQSLFAPETVKGIKGGSLKLTCVPPKAIIAHPTILWEKTTDETSENVASSVSGIPHISSFALKGRALMKGGNLTISSLQITDSGVYTCTVTAIQSRPQSAATQLIVTATPRILAFAERRPYIDENNTYVAATCVAESGQPKPSIRWTDKAGKVQISKEFTTLNSDGSMSVRSQLILTPGQPGIPDNSSHSVFSQSKVQEFKCQVDHENFKELRQRIRKVSVNILYSPFAYISLLGNRLTCHAEGNPQPSVTWLRQNGVISNNSVIYLKEAESENGFYSCRATSILKPDHVATLDVQRSRDLPVLFRTLVKLNTSLPTTASGYEITCSAEVEDLGESVHTLGFEWTRNGNDLPEGIYQITSHVSLVEKLSKTTLLSTLRFNDVVKGRDDAEFQCRLVNRTQVTGFVSAIERSVLVSVDYAPTQVSLNSKEFTIVEGKLLTLNCSADSQPLSVKEWYFNGVKIATGSTLQINGILRSESGLYRCLAYNYVPGSAFVDVRVTVLYPPTNLVIRKSLRGKLSCETEGGSLPPPIYSWIFPNQSIVGGNRSVVNLLVPPTTSKYTYTCVATNNLGISVNATYDQLPVLASKIGSLSVTEFSITMLFCIILGIAFVAGSGYLIYRKRINKSRSAEETFKRYLSYAGSPNNPVLAAEQKIQLTSHHVGELCAQSNHSTSLDSDEKRPALPKQHFNAYKCSSENPALECTPIANPPSSCVRSIQDLNTPQSHSTKQFVDGSSIEIMAIESLPSSTNQSTEQMSGDKSNETRTFDSDPSASTSQNQSDDTENSEDQTRSRTLPCSARLANIRRDVARHMQTLTPVQYALKGPIPHAYLPRLPLQVHHPHPVGLVVSGYDPVLYNATWRPTLSCPRSRASYSIPQGEAMRIYCDSKDFDSTNKLNRPIEDMKDFAEEIRPRSMSLSASSTSNKSYSHLANGDATNISEMAAEEFKLRVEQEEHSSLSAALFPFHSGDEAKGLFSTTNNSKKHQSVSLV